MKVLALSSSRVGNGGYLESAVPLIRKFLGDVAFNIAFIPFASVQKSYEEFGAMVNEALSPLPFSMSIITPVNAVAVIENADAIMVGGGNTFKLLHDIYETDIFTLILSKVRTGIPYIGWSAGANITGRTISTTNDMPIIQPRSFTAFGFFPFQINPHYINQKLDGHNGETRDQRLEEFVLVNPNVPVVALPEGTALWLQNGKTRFTGETEGILFQIENNLLKKSFIAPDEVLSL